MRSIFLKKTLDSCEFRVSIPKARLKKCREFAQLPIIDKVRPTDQKMLFIEGKTTLLGPEKNMDNVIEAFAKVMQNSVK